MALMNNTPFLGYCRTEVALKTFHHTWEIDNFWKAYRIMFPITTDHHKRNEPFIFRLDYNENKICLQLHMQSRTECKYVCDVFVSPGHIPCITDRVIDINASDSNDLIHLYDFPIDTFSSKKDIYTPGGILTICFQCKWCSDISLKSIYTTLSPSMEKLYIDKSNIPREKSLITFVIGDKQLTAHKDVICKRSTVFRAMFNSHMQEDITNEVRITDIKYDILELLLYYIEYDLLPEIDLDTVETLSDLFIAADKYDIQDLKLVCELQLMRLIHRSNYTAFLNAAWLDNTRYLKDYIQKFIQIRSEDMLNSQLTDLIQKGSKNLIKVTEFIKNHTIPICNTEINEHTTSNSLLDPFSRRDKIC